MAPTWNMDNAAAGCARAALDMSNVNGVRRASTDWGLPLFPITLIIGIGLELMHATSGVKPSMVGHSENDGSFEGRVFDATRIGGQTV